MNWYGWNTSLELAFLRDLKRRDKRAALAGYLDAPRYDWSGLDRERCLGLARELLA